MFIGRYYHTLENQGRVSLPKAFRAQASENQSWIVTRGLDGGLFVFREEDFQTKVAELAERTFTKKQNRDFVRLMVNDAVSVMSDAQGRVQLPEYLIEMASLQKEIVVVGSFSYLEIWSTQLYHTYLDQLSSQAESIAEAIAHDNNT